MGKKLLLTQICQTSKYTQQICKIEALLIYKETLQDDLAWNVIFVIAY